MEYIKSQSCHAQILYRQIPNQSQISILFHSKTMSMFCFPNRRLAEVGVCLFRMLVSPQSVSLRAPDVLTQIWMVIRSLRRSLNASLSVLFCFSVGKKHLVKPSVNDDASVNLPCHASLVNQHLEKFTDLKYDFHCPTKIPQLQPCDWEEWSFSQIFDGNEDS